MTPAGHKELKKRNVEKEYKRGPDNLLDTINSEDKEVAAELNLLGRQIYKVQEQEAFITLKDTKPNFLNNPQCRLINPTKSELGKVAKVILENIVKEVKSRSGLQLWKNTKSVIDWFKVVNNGRYLTFIQFDIQTYYPKITKKLVTKAIQYARQFTEISNQQKKIIIQSSRDILISEGKVWVKKGVDDKFSVTMGSYLGAELSELCGLYLLSLITQLVPRDQVGLYRDDGLLVTPARPRQADVLRKKLIELFRKEELRD